MMKYAINPSKKQIKAYLEGTEYDALNTINKVMRSMTNKFGYYSDKAIMAKQYSGTVTLRDGDEWDEEKGKELAKAKCLKNYRRAFNKRMQMFADDFGVIDLSLPLYLINEKGVH